MWVVLIRLGKRLKCKNPLPSKLVRFLEDPAVRKAGVNARGDAQKLRRDFKVRGERSGGVGRVGEGEECCER